LVSAWAQREPERQARFESEYRFVKRTVKEIRNPKGKLKDREATESRHDPLATNDTASESAARRAKDEREQYDRGDFPITAELLERFQFVFVAREDAAGRTAWVYDFAPLDEKLPSHGIKDRFINEITGRVWIDIREEAIVRVKLRLRQPVNIVGGIVASVRACNVEIRRGRTAEGLWYVERFSWRLVVRKLWTTRHTDYVEERLSVERAVGKSPSADEVRLLDNRAAVQSAGGASALR
jgi:hypothetical protein